MGKMQTFQQFLATQNVQVSILGFCINLLITAVMAELLSFLYKRYGRSLSNRTLFSQNFVLISMTTMVIISIVKSSLALSLGLVGALSIVRFRTAIKDPEELAYLFLNIAIGLGLGANQRIVTLVGYSVIVIIILLKNIKRREREKQTLYFVVSAQKKEHFDMQQVVETIKSFCSAVSLKRMDESTETMEAVFFVDFSDFETLNKCKKAIQDLHPAINISLTDLNNVT